MFYPSPFMPPMPEPTAADMWMPTFMPTFMPPMPEPSAGGCVDVPAGTLAHGDHGIFTPYGGMPEAVHTGYIASVAGVWCP